MRNRFILISALVGICCFLSSGCSSFFRVEKRNVDYYVMQLGDESNETSTVTTQKPINRRILVNSTTAPEMLDGSRIMFAREANKRGYYQYAAWVEPPPQSFYRLLFEKLRMNPKSGEVVKYSSLLEGDYLLNSTIVEMYHDASTDPGVVRMRVQFEMLDLKRDRVIGRLDVDKAVPVIEANACNAVMSFNQAVKEILLECQLWLERLKL